MISANDHSDLCRTMFIYTSLSGHLTHKV